MAGPRLEQVGRRAALFDCTEILIFHVLFQLGVARLVGYYWDGVLEGQVKTKASYYAT